MSTITRVRLWEDCGFTENCLEVPSKSKALPEPTMVFEGPFNVSKDRLFANIMVQADYLDLMNISYMEVTYAMNSGDDLTVYGWVDSVIVKSDSSGYPITSIDWHVDYWRTYLAKAVFGYGMVRRRRSNGTEPPQSYPYRWRDVVRHARLESQHPTIWWVYIGYTEGSGETATSRTLCVPVDTATSTQALTITDGGGGELNTRPTISLNDLITNSWDEKLGLTPSSIRSVFLCPFGPSSEWGYSNDTVSLPISEWNVTPNGDAGAFAAVNVMTMFKEQTVSFEQFKVTDTDGYLVTGFDGETVGSLPWGYSFDRCLLRIVADSVSGYVQLRFGLGSDVSKWHSNGTVFNVPMIPVEVVSNSWSEYVYTGARQSDIDQRRLSAEASFKEGTISTVTNTVGNAIGGIIGGAMMGGPLGAIAGGLMSSGVTALTSTLTNSALYDYRTGAYADEAQRIADYSHAMQSEGLIMSGSGFDCLHNGIVGITIVKASYDAYSKGVYDSDISLNGVQVSEPTQSVQTLVDAGGPLMVENLIVSGSIPVEAKQFFRTRLAKGVRMI